MSGLYRIGSIAGALCAGVWLLTQQAKADAPLRHLVYTFSVGIINASRDPASATGLASGVGNSAVVMTTDGSNSYKSNTSDKGEITIDILGMRPDGGLIVSAKEMAKDRNSADLTCVIFASTNVACSDPNPNAEILAVLRTLSPNFYDGVPMDEHHHWQVAEPKANVTIDFTARPETGEVVTIASQRDQTFKGAVSGSIHASASYEYDTKAYVSKSLKEYTTIREQTGPGSYSNITIDVSAQLLSDTGLKG